MAKLAEGAGKSGPAPNPPVRPLRELRAEGLLSIRGLALAAGVAPSTIALIEAGRTVPRRRVIRQIAAVLGVDPSEVTEFRQVGESEAEPPVAPPLTPADVLRRLEGVPPERPKALREALASTLELVADGERLLERMQRQMAQVRMTLEGGHQAPRRR